MNFCTCDPGVLTGVAIWSDELTDGPYLTRWTLLNVGTLKYVGGRDYLDRLEAIVRNYRLEFAVFEKYVNMGRKYKNAEKMITQQTLLCEQFRDVVLVGKRTWDPYNTKPKMQAEIIRDYGIAPPKNEHESDAVHMALNIFRRLPYPDAEKADRLHDAAVYEHKIRLVA